MSSIWFSFRWCHNSEEVSAIPDTRCAGVCTASIQLCFHYFARLRTVFSPFTPINLLLSSQLYLLKCLLAGHQETPADSLHISLQLPLMRSLLLLYKQKDHPSGRLIHPRHNVYRKHTKDFITLQISHTEGQ